MIETTAILFTVLFFIALGILAISKSSAYIKIIMTLTTSLAMLAIYLLFFYFQGSPSSLTLPEEFQIKHIEVKGERIYLVIEYLDSTGPFLYGTEADEESKQDAQEIADMLKKGKIVKVKKGNKGKKGSDPKEEGDKEGRQQGGGFSLSDDEQFYILPDPTLNRKDEQ